MMADPEDQGAASGAIAPPPARRPGRGIQRHLVIVHQPGWQAFEDWREIAAHVHRIDPTTGVIIVSSTVPNEEAAALAAQLPTLVVSPGPLGEFKPQRGKVYHGQLMWKFDELRRLAAAGVPVPRSQLLQPGTKLNPTDWGEFVIVKPTHSSEGNGVQLMRTERVRFIKPEDYPEGHPGRSAPMLVQQFIDCGERINIFRVLTLLGEPLYCQHVTAAATRVPLTADDATIEGAAVTTQAHDDRDRAFVYNADVVALARRAHFAIPEVPLKGVDIIRDAKTGNLYVLEINPRSNTWHFSSQLVMHQRAAIGGPPPEAYKAQLDAFGTAAHVLANVTRREAV